MRGISLGFGQSSQALDLDQLHLQEIVQANKLDLPDITPDQAVREALAHPIASPPLPELVAKGDKICVIVPDITRIYETPFVSLPPVLEQLHAGGVTTGDIVILCATGTHRRHSAAEHAKLLGEDIVRNYRVIDHQCGDETEMREVGRTSRGTPVWLNRHAVDADKIVIICGVVYHFLAGFGGGGKMLVPGVAAKKTIQANHELALNPGFGNGHNPEVRSGNLTAANPFHADIFEAAGMLPPVFSLNVVVNDTGRIVRAFAGDWRKAHQSACELVAQIEGVTIEKRANFVIATAGGAPKDINLYQGVKLLANARAAAMPGALIILLLACPEGLGNEDLRRIMCYYDNMIEREKDLRRDFSIGSFVGYYLCDSAEKNDIILVTDIPAANFQKTRITAVKNLAEAMKLAKTRSQSGEPCIVMPHGSSTFPIPAM